MTRYDPLRHHRRSIRLKGYDYTQAGAYFVTMCAHGRECLFGDIANGVVRLNDCGRIAAAGWNALPRHFAHATLDAFVIMPNHLHGLVLLSAQGKGETFAGRPSDRAGAGAANASPQRPNGTQPGSLGAILQNFKSISTRKINTLRATPGAPVWQRNYYERIVRDDRALNAIRHYIANNPLKWALDRDNPTLSRPLAATTDEYWPEAGA